MRFRSILLTIEHPDLFSLVFAAVRLYILWDKSYVVAGSILGPGLVGSFFILVSSKRYHANEIHCIAFLQYYDAHAVIDVATQPSVYKCTMATRFDQSLGRGLLQQYMILWAFQLFKSAPKTDLDSSLVVSLQ